MRLAVAAAAALAAAPALAQPLPVGSADPTEPAFRALYKELVETNTTLSAGSCTRAAQQVAGHLKRAGFRIGDLTIFSVPEHPEEGGLVAVLPGADPALKPILMLAHIDVVEARREDWTRDPFTLIEENGFFYGRGVADDKAQAAIYADTMVRLKKEQSAPGIRGQQGLLKRTVKLALTCGEETSGAFNGAQWLAENRRELIDAEFAMNEGGGGRVGPDGKPQLLALQVGEKHYQDYRIETTNPGGHSSAPRPDNAIYSLSRAIGAVERHRFPVLLNPTTTAFFKAIGPTAPAPAGPAMTAIASNPRNAAAEAVLSQDPMLNSTMRTTCVATLVNAGHAQNALPQRATGNVNCRIAPGDTVEGTRAALVAAIDDPAVSVTAHVTRNKVAIQPPLSDRILKPAQALAATHYPGVPLVPIMSTGATDGPFLAAVGIPVYGVPGILYEADGGGIHGLNEKIRVKSVMDGRAYLYNLLKAYAND